MKIVDAASIIWYENGEPTDTTLAFVAYWLRNRVGWLNTMLYEDFTINSGLELVDGDGAEVSPAVISILIQLFKVYRLEVDIRSSMNALAANPILTVKDELGGTSYSRINRNEVSKTYVSIRKDELKILQDMIHSYHSLKSSPSAVAGDDTVAGFMGGAYTYRPFVTRVGPYGT